MWETIRGYLTFTRKERFGVLFLLLLISILFVLPYFFRPHPGDPDPEAYEKLKDGILKFEAGNPDSSHKTIVSNRYPHIEKPELMPSKGSPALKTRLFYFDPNTLRKEDWQRLGLSGVISQTIRHYVEKGGRFRKPEDLKKIFGLLPSEYERLLPYVRITVTVDPFPKRNGGLEKFTIHEPGSGNSDSISKTGRPRTHTVLYYSRSIKNAEIIDINLADSAAWSGLPGIGARLSARIVRFREKLGGFYQVDQVGETYGMPDSIFQKIKPFLRLNQVSIVKIDLNRATKESLGSHPYIRWQIANEIIAYRSQHGRFQSVDELLQLAQIDTLIFRKLKPYLMLVE